MANLDGIRKEFWNTASFQMILKEAAEQRPNIKPFMPTNNEPTELQIEAWKAKSAERRGFDAAFQFITGHNIEDLL